MILSTIRCVSTRRSVLKCGRSLSTLSSNPHIYIHPHPLGNSHILSLLPTTPPTQRLSIGTTSSIPPTTDTFVENKEFLGILDKVLSQHAADDPDLKSQAAAFASTSGSSLGSGGQFFPQQRKRGDGAGGASSQGGAGGGGRGGWVHCSDTRAPPDYGRIAWPEDIFGSLEVDGSGEFVEGDKGKGRGNWQSSGTYRIITRDGILGLSPFLRGKLVEDLKRREREG